MTDTLDFVKNLWGSMNIPGVGMPGMTASSLSTDDLDKKITDLKAVESWLNLNIGMLRGTIQALEVQRGTLATLKAMSDGMAQAMGGAGSDPAMAAPFAQFFAQSAVAPTPPPPLAPKAGSAAAPGAAAGAAGEAGANAAMPAAVAWWNLLQDQFRQAVASAIPTPSPGGDAGDGAPSAPPAEAKTQGGSPLDASGGASQPDHANHSASGRAGRNPRSKADKG
ncbi:PhaM family polyhydroxyalkanoate granule multifunctional regulatory protein [Massilia yuzhufengensis]|nr:PhaM family polyhydroxyalkanoate granule multifunctional regulatory protein [Massilia yuzhufengensis]